MEEDIEKILEIALHIRSTKFRKNYTNEEKFILTKADYYLDERVIFLESLDDHIGVLREKSTIPVDSERSWQPNHYVPIRKDDRSKIKNKTREEIEKEVNEIGPELLAVLFGDMLTEEGLPIFSDNVRTPEGMRDYTGVQQNNMAKWSREWVGDESKHGSLLEMVLYMHKLADQNQVEATKQRYFIGGNDPGIGQDPYKLVGYTGIQEPATRISHTNTAKLAKKAGSEIVYDVCLQIARDESRHAGFYQALAKKIFECDPNNALTAYAYQLRKKIKMPAQNIRSKNDEPLFDQFENLAHKLEIYTTTDYKDVIEKTIERYNIKNLDPTTEKAKRAQKFILERPEVMEKMQEKHPLKIKPFNPKEFPWLKPFKSSYL